MMNKEEYKKEIIRMWDSLRDDKYKGSCDCVGVPCCEECALYQNGVHCCVSTNAFEMIEVVERWSKEHKEKKKMMTKEEYKKEIVRMWDSIRDDEYKIYNACNGVSCSKCPLHGIGCSEPLSSYEVVEIVKKWSEEHPPKKYKVSRMEYDILQTVINFGSSVDTFNDFCTLSGLLEKGYFEEATGDMYISDYYNNCEVKENV